MQEQQHPVPVQQPPPTVLPEPKEAEREATCAATSTPCSPVLLHRSTPLPAQSPRVLAKAVDRLQETRADLQPKRVVRESAATDHQRRAEFGGSRGWSPHIDQHFDGNSRMDQFANACVMAASAREALTALPSGNKAWADKNAPTTSRLCPAVKNAPRAPACRTHNRIGRVNVYRMPSSEITKHPGVSNVLKVNLFNW